MARQLHADRPFFWFPIINRVSDGNQTVFPNRQWCQRVSAVLAPDAPMERSNADRRPVALWRF